MKIPLRYQITENDSGRTALLNTISYLFEREEADDLLLKNIYKHSINKDDIFKEQETTCVVAKKLLNKKKYKLNLIYLKEEEVNLKAIKENMKTTNSCMIVHMYLNGKSHYSLVTSLDNNYVYLFDSYYLDDIYFDEERMVELVFDNPFTYNRKINLKRFNSLPLNDFALGPVDHRECLIIQKQD